jgi:hypothetical protein
MMDDVSSTAPEFFFNCSRKAYKGKQMNENDHFRQTSLDSTLHIQTTWVQFYARYGDTSANSFTHVSMINKHFCQCLDLAGKPTRCGPDNPL